MERKNDEQQRKFRSTSAKKSRFFYLLPLLLPVITVFIWWLSGTLEFYPSYMLPSPLKVLISFKEEISSGRLIDDAIASLWRAAIGFCISTFIGVPFGLWLGQSVGGRQAFLPFLNFFRFLSPLAWIPFAILWFQIGDKPAIFLIFMATFFPIVISTTSAVSTIPAIFFRVAHDYNFNKVELMTKVIFPAVLPQLISSLRLSYGVAWVVIVAAEMVGCQDGLGYGIWEARNGLRLDSAICYMFVIGLLGLGIDRLLYQFTKFDNIRWGYEK